MGVKDYSVLISVVHMDEYYSIDSWPEEGDKTEMTPMAKQPGGRVANTACVMSSLGDEIKFFDVLSRDATDSYLLEDLQQYGVDIAKDKINSEDKISDLNELAYLLARKFNIALTDTQEKE